MIWPAKMLKLRMYCLSSRSYDLVSDLHEAGVLHLKEAALPGVGLGGAMSAFDRIAELNSALSPLKRYVEEESSEILPLRKAISEAEKLVEKSESILKLSDALKKSNLKKEELVQEAEALKMLIKWKVSYPSLPSSIVAYVTKKKPEGKLINLEEKEGFFVVVAEKGKHTPETPEFFLPRTSPKKELERVEKELSSVEKDISRLEKELSKKVKELKSLPAVLHSFNVHAERAKAFSNFARTQRVVVIEGWVPEKKKGVIERLAGKYDPACFLEWLGEDENGPTLIENPESLKPFEFAYDFSSLPKAGEMNASFFYALTFPLIYGMIIGDVFYSLVAILIVGALRSAFPESKKIRSLSAIWTVSAIGGILWGIAFDEWMGASHMFYIEKAKAFGIDFGIEMPLYHGIHRLHELPLLLGLSGLVAILHLTFGNLLGAYTAFKHHHQKHGLARLGWAIAFASFGVLMASYLGVIDLIVPSALALTVGVVLIFMGEGPIGILELPSLASNSASYFRIAAVGIAGVVLAEILNEMIFPSPSMGLAGSIALFIIFFLLHSVNAFIAAFESTIQGGRLEILEFRSKFIEGGGKPYSPFALKKR